MLNVSTLLMSIYGTYSIGWAANDLFEGAQLEPWASWTVLGFGVLLVLGALVSRARIPGGLPVAGAALLGLQAMDVHGAAHLDTPMPMQITRAAFAVVLMGLAFYGALPSRPRVSAERQREG